MKHFINNPLFASTLLNLKQAEEVQNADAAIPFHRKYPPPRWTWGEGIGTFPCTVPTTICRERNEQTLGENVCTLVFWKEDFPYCELSHWYMDYLRLCPAGALKGREEYDHPMLKTHAHARAHTQPVVTGTCRMLSLFYEALAYSYFNMHHCLYLS